MSKKNVHINPRGDKWIAQRPNSNRASGIYDTQQEAIEAGRSLAINSQSELIIHNKKGRIRERSSYGNDPYPPKG